VAGSIEDTGPLISQLSGVEDDASNPGFKIRLGCPGADENTNIEVRPDRTTVNAIDFFIFIALALNHTSKTLVIKILFLS